jgi:hypothetical protein
MARRQRIIPWGIGILATTALVVWVMNRPDQLQSTEQKDTAGEANLRLRIERETAEFNRGLSALVEARTVAKDTDYPSATIAEVAKLIGLSLSGMMLKQQDTPIPGKGRPFKLSGVIVSNEPDPDEKQSEPRYFTLEKEDSTLTIPDGPDEAIKFMSEHSINLDIESLNRYERQFIIDHCNFLISVTKRVPPTYTSILGHGCRATVLGHIDEIPGRSSAYFGYVGLIADQVDIEPL